MGPSTSQSFMESVAFVHHYKMTFSFARICPSSERLYYDSYSYGLSGKRTSSSSRTNWRWFFFATTKPVGTRHCFAGVVMGWPLWTVK